jgi:divalent metal cation (Fe/Co/Zn/Cd) transporter
VNDPGRRPPRITSSLVALVLALGVATFIAAAGVGVTWHQADDQLSEQSANLLATVIGATIGAVATYLGMGGDRDRGGPPQ